MAKGTTKRIRIVLRNGPDEEHINSKEAEYFTAVGVAGELILYRVSLHAMLSAKMEPVIWKVWAPGKWESMEHDEV